MENFLEFPGINEEEEIGLPPGFRFHPTDEELITHYLTPKFVDSSFCAKAIGEVDFNKIEPWDLPWKAKMGEKEWYFFCMRDKKYPTGHRTNRATNAGYWKATGKDKEIFKLKTLVGMKKTLVFYKGRAPRGEKSNWIMHEYRLEGKYSINNLPQGVKNEWVICRIYNKSAGGKKMHISGLIKSNNIMNENLPPLIDLSSYNGNLCCSNSPELLPHPCRTIQKYTTFGGSDVQPTTFSENLSYRDDSSHITTAATTSTNNSCFSNISRMDQKTDDFCTNSHPTFVENNFQYGDFGLMQDQSILNYEGDHDFTITSAGQVDLDCLWNY